MEKITLLMTRTDIPCDEIQNDDFDKLWPHIYFTKHIEINNAKRLENMKIRLQNIEPDFLQKN